MSNVVYIEEYSPKSFVVRGETKQHKDSLLALGGKWNSSLTDKQSGDKFGAWLFWGEKRKEISDWIEKGCKTAERSQQTSVFEKSSSDDFSSNRDNTSRLEAKIDALTKMVESLCRYHNIDGSKKSVLFDSDVESDEDVPPVKPKRLLSKK
jgi:hypothetical protein